MGKWQILPHAIRGACIFIALVFFVFLMDFIVTVLMSVVAQNVSTVAQKEPAVIVDMAAAARDGRPPTGPAATIREQDQYMPIANVIRIMRRILPPHAKISDDAKETIQECVSEYISFITGEANDRCQREQRKTITAEDVLWAMGKLGFDDYVEPLSVFLNRYREIECDRTSLRGEPFIKRAVEYSPAAPVSAVPPPSHAMPPPPAYGTAFFHPHMAHHPPPGLFDNSNYFHAECPSGNGGAASSAAQVPVFNNYDYGQFK